MTVIDEAGFAARVRELLDTVRVMTLATHGPRGPWAADVFFATENLSLYFLSSPTSRHGSDLETDPACAATVHAPAEQWKDIRGLQIEGSAERLSPVVDAARVLRTYTDRFPMARELLAHPGGAAAKVGRVRPYSLVPRRVRLIDNSLGFGARLEMDVRSGRFVGSLH